MAVKYESVVPWGRNFDEYCKMFSLSQKDLRLSILDCAAGPSSFNKECNERQGNVTSFDPLFNFTKEKIQSRIAETYEEVLNQTIKNKEKYNWDKFGSPIQLGSMRMATMRKFLSHYEKGKKEKRYIAGVLPSLPFPPESFDLVLCSHFLFLYSAQLDYDFHVKSIKAMLNVGKQLRIFPLVDHNANTSPYLKNILQEFKDYEPKVQTVDYEFQKGAHQMLTLSVPVHKEEDDFYRSMRRKYT